MYPLLVPTLRPLNVMGARAPTVARAVWAAMVPPVVHGALAWPFVPVSTLIVAPLGNDPPPAVTEKATETPATGVFDASFTSTVSGATKADDTVCTWLSPDTSATLAAAPAAVAVKVIVGTPVNVAVSVFVPEVAPSVQLPSVAMPLPFVIAVAPVTEPPPEATANVTLAPVTGVPAKSRTSTEGAMASATDGAANWLLPALIVIETGTPAVPWTHTTGTGVRRCTKLASPTWPTVLSPQQYGCPAAVRAHVVAFLARMEANAIPPNTAVGADWSVVVPSPTCPDEFTPQQ